MPKSPSQRRAAARSPHRTPAATGGADASADNAIDARHRLAEMRAALDEIAHDLWWTWNEIGQRPFAALDPLLWEATAGNPVAVLRRTPLAVLEARLAEPSMQALVQQARAALHEYRTGETWYDRSGRAAGEVRVAYLCSEFALHESMPQYAGGLGVLAGDHLKSASDLGIPLCGVGLLYAHGYYRQQLREDGSTRVLYPLQDPAELPIVDTGVRVRCPIGDRSPTVAVWMQRIGRTRLFLLDTNLPGNAPEDRALTEGLYKGPPQIRLEQQVLLGVGGMIALEALGEHPTVVHLNEGHAAFAGLWMLADAMHRGASEGEAIERVRARLVFTTHTPVPAGHDRYPFELALPALAPVLRRGGFDRRLVESLAREDPAAAKEPLCMTVLALRLARFSNGVSTLHGAVSRRMWAQAHGVEESEADAAVPIGAITNGVHLPTWMHPLSEAFWRRSKVALPASAPEAQPLHDAAARGRVDLEAFWGLRNRLRSMLVRFVRERLVRQAIVRGEDPDRVDRAAAMLREDALTIGFARRFATYKRAVLVLSDLKRLARILGDEKRPVQLIFAGKAHPRDEGGQAFAQLVFEATRHHRLEGRLVLLEEYDMRIGRMLVAGCDLWLNTPVRPHEASGTSGMKVPLNGGINCSIADGWWPEADDGRNGWTIPASRHTDPTRRDRDDARSLYRLLEREIVPEFHRRTRGGLPKAWLQRALRSAATVAPRFTSDRMVGEYLDAAYRGV